VRVVTRVSGNISPTDTRFPTVSVGGCIDFDLGSFNIRKFTVMFPKPFTAGASITGGYGLRFRKVGLLTCRHPSPRCLLGIPTRHSISRVEVQWQTSFGKLILEGGNVGAAQGFLERILGASQTIYSGRTVPEFHRSSLLSNELQCSRVTLRSRTRYTNPSACQSAED
jgi:hypothetical protein